MDLLHRCAYVITSPGASRHPMLSAVRPFYHRPSTFVPPCAKKSLPDARKYLSLWATYVRLWKRVPSTCAFVTVFEDDAWDVSDYTQQRWRDVLSESARRNISVAWMDARSPRMDNVSMMYTVAVAFDRRILADLVAEFENTPEALWNRLSICVPTDMYLGLVVRHKGWRGWNVPIFGHRYRKWGVKAPFATRRSTSVVPRAEGPPGP